MGALLTVHETIAIDKQKQCSTQYRALLYYGKNKKSSNDIADGTIPSAVRPQRGPSSIHRGPFSIHLCAIKYIITKKVVPCCLSCLFKNKWCYLKQL